MGQVVSVGDVLNDTFTRSIIFYPVDIMQFFPLLKDNKIGTRETIKNVAVSIYISGRYIRYETLEKTEKMIDEIVRDLVPIQGDKTKNRINFIEHICEEQLLSEQLIQIFRYINRYNLDIPKDIYSFISIARISGIKDGIIKKIRTNTDVDFLLMSIALNDRYFVNTYLETHDPRCNNIILYKKYINTEAAILIKKRIVIKNLLVKCVFTMISTDICKYIGGIL